MSGFVDLYVVDSPNILSFCDTKTFNDTLISKHIIIDINKTETNEYQLLFDESDTLYAIKITHNLNGEINYVLRLNNKQRILSGNNIIDLNTFIIYIPNQILLDLENNSFLDLIVFCIDNNIYKNNIFKTIEFSNLEENNNHDLIVNHNFNTTNIDSIIRLTDNKIDSKLYLPAIFNNKIIDFNTIIYDLPDYLSIYNDTLKYIYRNQFDHINKIDKLLLYTTSLRQTIYLTNKNVDGVIEWSNIDINNNNNHYKYNCVKIKHNLPGIVNLTIRDFATYSIFNGFIDIVEDNQIILIFSEKYDINMTYVINLYTIYLPDKYSIDIN